MSLYRALCEYHGGWIVGRGFYFHGCACVQVFCEACRKRSPAVEEL